MLQLLQVCSAVHLRQIEFGAPHGLRWDQCHLNLLKSMKNAWEDSTLNLPGKCELDGPHSAVAANETMVWVHFGDYFGRLPAS
jgi:hypothetical protein